MTRLMLIVLLSIAMSSLGGCAVVKPWERDLLSLRGMEFESDPLEAAREAHIYFSKEGSMPGGSAGGGGCGCN